MNNLTLHCSRLVWPFLAAAVLAFAMPAWPARAQEADLTRHGLVRGNAPGLECRQTTHPVFAFASPSPSAPLVARFPNTMAISGPAVGEWVPVELDDGRRGWVLAAQTLRNSSAKSCFVTRAKNGRLIYAVHNRIS